MPAIFTLLIPRLPNLECRPNGNPAKDRGYGDAKALGNQDRQRLLLLLCLFISVQE
jgi:hypothetical protein